MKLKNIFIFILSTIIILPFVSRSIPVGALSLDEQGEIDYTAAQSTISSSGNTFHAVTFNPKASDYLPYCVAGPSGQGKSSIAAGRELIEKGYDVYAGMNTVFYALGDRST